MARTTHAGQVEHEQPAEQGGHATHHGHAKHGHAQSGHDHVDHAAMFRDRLWVSLVLAVPIVATADMIQVWLGYSLPAFPGEELLAPVLGLVVFAYGGWPFLTGGWQELRARQPGMMLLVGMAITVATAASLATTLGLVDDLDFWWEVALLIVIMLLGHWLEMRAIGQARGALQALAELLPDEAEIVAEDGSTRTVGIGDLSPADVVLVRPGGRVPADGRIVRGAAELDESMVTGESAPVPRGEGDQVVAGTVATDAAIRVEVEAVGDDTALAGIQRLVAEAQESRSRTQVLADRAAALLFYAALVAAVVTATTWLVLGEVDASVTRSVTVLVIACPHALGLAIPLVTAISTSLGARRGILVRDRLALERTRLVDAVLFDKTGTLTRGEHRVTGVASVDGGSDRVLTLAAAVEGESEHPLARAIVAAAGDRDLDVPDAADLTTMTGRGVGGRVGGREVAVGGPSLLRERELDEPAALTDAVTGWRARGASVLHVIDDGRVVGALALEDVVREESREAVAALHDAGVRVMMITGDAQEVADAVAADLGIDEVFAEVLPEDKDHAVTELQERGLVVAMVGDGVNDAPALARADVGIAIGAGTDVAIESAGIVLASDDPRAVLAVVGLSRASDRKARQNLWWAAGYNLVAIPLAAGILAPIGFVLPMSVGAVLMSLSTIIVALNAQLLRRADLAPPAAGAPVSG